ncbi:MAG: TPM domain-containing protein [Bacteroidales bacterium]|nr:TPM domain-containing protein [Bacteroidales bacterium]
MPNPPSPQRLVNDFANVFPKSGIDSLERVLVAFDDSTSNQICVVTVKSLDGYDVSEYTAKLGNQWGVGSSRNNGVVVLIKARGEEDYIDVSIQTGRGLEGAIPDAYASRIIRNDMGPWLKDRKDNYFAATCAACDKLMKLASGEIKAPREDKGDEESTEEKIFIIIFTIAILIWLVFKFKKFNKNDNSGSSGPKTYHDYDDYGSSRRSSWGGGWSSGSSGGSSSGGFGGFGGGSFGGGGASGRF